MALGVHSKFYYGYAIDSRNNAINFNEGSGELTASITIGSYSMSELPIAIKTAMDAVGTLEYTVTVDRATRVFTISSTASFDLLIGTGSQVGSSPWSLLGFGSQDLTSSSSYSGVEPSGSQYLPQFWLQNYQAPDTYKERVGESINESASGALEIISFGVRRFVEFDIKFITNLPADGKLIKNNVNGLNDLISFMDEITLKNTIEFMPDENDSATFYRLILESTPLSNTGVGFKLKENVDSGRPGYYDTGVLKFRVKE